MFMLVFCAAMHANSLALLLLGLPFDRSLPWHRMLGLSATFQGLLHGLTYYLDHRQTQTRPRDSEYWMIHAWRFGPGMEISGAARC